MSDDDKHRARIFFHRGQLAQAKDAYEQAVTDDRLGDNPRELSASLGNLGNVCALSGDFEMAETCYREVLTIQRLLAALYVREQNSLSAIRCLERVVSLDQH